MASEHRVGVGRPPLSLPRARGDRLVGGKMGAVEACTLSLLEGGGMMGL